MATFTVGLAEAADSGFSQGTVWTAGILLGGHQSSSMDIGIRWLNVTVPAAATITSASIHIRARSLDGTAAGIHFKVKGHKGDAPQWAEGTFEPDLNFTATTAAPDYDPAAWVTDTYYDVDITTVVQEIVNGTWASGNDLAVVFFNDSSTSENFVQMYRFADGDTAANVITINYTASSPVTITPGLGSQPHTGRAPLLGFGIDMPNQAMGITGRVFEFIEIRASNQIVIAPA